jgi:hypothetical protein
MMALVRCLFCETMCICLHFRGVGLFFGVGIGCDYGYGYDTLCAVCVRARKKNGVWVVNGDTKRLIRGI